MKLKFHGGDVSRGRKKVTSIIISTPTTSQAEPSSSLSGEENESMSAKIRSLQDIYEATNELHLMCLLADMKDITFEQTLKDEKWQATMQEEMNTIDKNDT
jgi:glutathionylspermidine synthase